MVMSLFRWIDVLSNREPEADEAELARQEAAALAELMLALLRREDAAPTWRPRTMQEWLT
jgi:hypothetical protein